MPDRETLFITGFPGFIANRLLERLAGRQSHFILLVQPALATRARDEIARIMAVTGKSADDFQIVEGDITEPALALKPADLDLVRQQTTRVFHLAAIYDLAVPREPAMRVNPGGTRNVNTSPYRRCIAGTNLVRARISATVCTNHGSFGPGGSWAKSGARCGETLPCRRASRRTFAPRFMNA